MNITTKAAAIVAAVLLVATGCASESEPPPPYIPPSGWLSSEPEEPVSEPSPEPTLDERAALVRANEICRAVRSQGSGFIEKPSVELDGYPAESGLLTASEDEVRDTVASHCPEYGEQLALIDKKMQTRGDRQSRIDAGELVGPGGYLVGFDMDAGTWQTVWSKADDFTTMPCHWSRESGPGEWIEGSPGLMLTTSRVTVTLKKGENFSTDKACGDWEKVG